jgi:hypothetical protein
MQKVVGWNPQLRSQESPHLRACRVRWTAAGMPRSGVLSLRGPQLVDQRAHGDPMVQASGTGAKEVLGARRIRASGARLGARRRCTMAY